MSPKLKIEQNNKLKENPFRVPDGYFEKLEGQLQSIAAEDPPVVQLRQRSYRKKLLAIAAALTVLLTSTWFLSQNKDPVYEELNAEEIAALSDNGYVSFTETELLEFVSVDDLDDFWPDTETGAIDNYLESTDLLYADDYYLYEDI